MNKIAVVDDCKEYIELISEILGEERKKRNLIFEIDTFQKASSLLYELNESSRNYWIYLLDIEMPEMNGMELARKIRKKSSNSYLIFITSHMEFAIEGYEVEAYQYILKSRLREKLPQILDKLFQQEELERVQGYYKIVTNHRCEKFLYRDIICIYKEGKNSIFVTKAGEFQERKTLQYVFEELPKEQFMFVERGRIVNIALVSKVKSAEVVMYNGEAFSVSRSHVSKVREQVLKYWSE